ncbi:transmembrane protein 218 [Scyliorhinus canicula]|uniref:transmembrane protein 218 n=1 Tax=Scyliorhinus canicula TaxID=7830 RepID=UPI0018F2CC6B|nr:transmembrane protein 218 [Scyliorhinus canicula]XP_038635397.1 transmembrane protein 218 [Scyliorhinus canicula]XP_038635398.1 transmembrane protein 218 [Scyliorhinus canicula]
MHGTIMGVGAGIFILAVVWILVLLACMLLSRSGDMISWLSTVFVFFLALILTMILIFFPRAKEIPEPVTEDVVYDTFFIGRYSLLCILIVTILISLILLFPHYLAEHVEAKLIRN